MKRYLSIFIYSISLVLTTAICTFFVTALFFSARASGGKETVTIPLEEYRILQGYEKLGTLRQGIHQYFYQPVQDDTLSEGAYYGMVESLKDPYSSYLSAEQMEALKEADSGIYIGIGATFLTDPNSGLLTVTRIYPGSPVAGSGVAVGDTLYSVNGTLAAGLDLPTITAMIRGEEGSTVTVEMQRGDQVKEYSFTRERIEIVDVETKMLDGDILLVRLYAFSTRADQAFAEALAQGLRNNMKGLIVDLRGNGGGSGAIVQNIADELLPEGLIFYAEDNQGLREEYKSDAKRLDLPLALLTDGGSASASEILVAAVQDYGVGSVIGQKTFGKAIGQATLPIFDDGSGLYITTVGVYSPKGRTWHGTGLQPDQSVELPQELIDNPLLLTGDSDTQLQAALELLRSGGAAN
ncbi:MAG: S41 family peptidase [Christensenellaceae bacterium]|jgi:carboxyl-terminal processing protease|nr:S41 family peptidase [Christensenellaceae bacterium]